jgi:hypothetical protein
MEDNQNQVYNRKKILIKQTMEELFKQTFSDSIQNIGEANVYFIGKKMYIKTEKVIISVEFVGTEMAYNILDVRAFSIYGIIDQNVTPLKNIFKETKLPNGEEKCVKMQILSGITGDYSPVWNSLTDEDKNTLNNFLSNYIELFISLE